MLHLPFPMIPISYWANPHRIVSSTAMAYWHPWDTWTRTQHRAAKHNRRIGLIQRKYLKLLCHAFDEGYVDDDCWQTSMFSDIVPDWFVMVICA